MDELLVEVGKVQEYLQVSVVSGAVHTGVEVCGIDLEMSGLVE